VNNNFGGYMGGPIFRDRTFFLGAFERLSINSKTTVLS
jgi:hypothetical protein